MLNKINSKSLKIGLLALSASILATTAASSPAFAGEKKTVSLQAGQVFELTFLKDLAQPANGRERTTKFYNESLERQIKRAGGEFVFALDTVSVEEGLIAPDAIGFTVWPSMDAYRKFAKNPAVANHKTDVQHLSTFLQVPQDTTFTLDEDKYYEWFGVNFNPVNQPQIMEFFGAVIPTAIQKHGRKAVADFTVLNVPESTFPSQAVGLVEWPSNIDFKNFSDSDVIQNNVQKRNGATDNFYAIFGDVDL